MKPMSSRFKPSALILAAIVGAAAVGAAIAQPPGPGGGFGPKDGGAPGPGPGDPGPGPGGPGGPGGAPPSDTFVFRVCNRTNDIPNIFVATVGIVTPQEFRANGWARIGQGQCTDGTFGRPRLWVHARAGSITWTKGLGPLVPLCVNLNAGFNYVWNGQSRNCPQGEVAVNFVELEVAPNATTRTLDLN